LRWRVRAPGAFRACASVRGPRAAVAALALLRTSLMNCCSAQAWLGDAALDFIVALMGTKEGLSVAQMDRVSQRQLCNKALAGCAREQLASETLTATEVEASVGRSLTPLIDDLLELLLPALREANPELASDLRGAVMMETC
jgi:hypothetical protein